MKMTKEIEEFINLTITEHMGKSYADWKLSQSSVTESDEIEKAYRVNEKQENSIRLKE